jgi:toxin YoeB
MRLSLNSNERKAVFQPELIEDLRYRVETDRTLAQRMFNLIDVILQDSFDGTGKPELLEYLTHKYSG